MSSRNWCFTIYPQDFPYDEETHIFSTDGLSHLKYAVWQLERCPTTSRPHLQGYAEFDKVTALRGGKKFFHDNFQSSVHLEKRKGTQAQAIAYCRKEESRIAGPWTAGEPAIRGQRNDIHAVVDRVNNGADYWSIAQEFPLMAARFTPFVNKLIEKRRKDSLVPPAITLHPWQEELHQKVLNTPHPRQILWYWETIGNTGKTTFAKWLARSYPEKVQVFVGGKHADVAFALDSAKSIFIFDFARSSKDFLNYGLLEQVKNGVVFSGKYESASKEFNIPHVIVFANHEPEYDQLSRDRWDTYHIAALMGL